LARPASGIQIDIPPPPGAHTFGWQVTVLPNHNIVIQDPSAGDSFAGAVYLYSPSGTLISTLRGSVSGDSVGYDRIIVLPSGNFLVPSRDWHNGSAQRAGAVTWVNGTTGLEGFVSPANSLVGSSENDQVGSNIVLLANGNYVVASENWTNNGAFQAGAATFVPADGSVHGAVSAANSLVGETAQDYVGAGVVALTNGNYIVVSRYWSNGEILGAGAVTWANGQTGIAGAVSAQNSLVGSTAFDSVGGYDIENRVWALSNGNAVVVSPMWDNGAIADAGASTWIDGTKGLTGPISAANSLVGASASDRVGEETGNYYGFAELPGGRYAVQTPRWNNEQDRHVGAITWGDIAVGIHGVISSANSLVGATSHDLFAARVFALDDGNWVVGSPQWSNGNVQSVGAATWIDGSAPLVGAITAENSLIGTTGFDEVGTSITALRDGRYVVASPAWHNGDVYQAGAATWVDREGPRNGVVSAANSLVGSTETDSVGSNIVVLTNGNYLVATPQWSRDGVIYVGAVTWARGDTGITGAVSTQNSLVGDSERDRVGSAVHPLSNGNAVVSSTGWHGLGAATWIDGATGRIDTVSAQNSLVGDVFLEGLGNVVAFNGTGNYLVMNQNWNEHAGAVAWGNGHLGLVGEITAANTLVGTGSFGGIGNEITMVGNGNALAPGDASVTLVRGASPTVGPVNSENSALNAFGHRASSFDYDATRDRLVVGWFQDNYVSIFQTETLLEDGFE
jgi:hypothetical protein